MLKCNIIDRLIQLLGRHVRFQLRLQLCSDVLKNRGLKFPCHTYCISINVAEECLRSSHIDASSNISMDRQVSTPSSPRKELSVPGNLITAAMLCRLSEVIPREVIIRALTLFADDTLCTWHTGTLTVLMISSICAYVSVRSFRLYVSLEWKLMRKNPNFSLSCVAGMQSNGYDAILDTQRLAHALLYQCLMALRSCYLLFPEFSTWALCLVMAGLRMKISSIVSAVQSCRDIGSYASHMGNTASVSSTGFHSGEHVYGPVLAILLQLLASVPKE